MLYRLDATRVPKLMTREQFLAWEVRQELRYEFDGFQPVAMTGGTAAHSAIQHNSHVAIGGRLRGARCRFHGSDLQIETAKGFRYPDGFIVCNPLPPHATIVGDPVVIFEVLSDSTAGIDLVTKNHEYAAIPSGNAKSCWLRTRWLAPCSSVSTTTGSATCLPPTAYCTCRRSAS